MENLLNRGLNFSLLPLKMDLTQVLVDFKRFERTLIWQEFWYGRDQNEDRKETIFKTKKRNMPRNYTSPQGLQTFIGAVKSEIMDPRNRNKVPCNIPQEEICALKELIRLQRDRKIVIKACDKGAGIIILNFEDYLKACYNHLGSEQAQPEGPSKPFYTEVNEFEIDRTKSKILSVLEIGLKEQIISEHEFNEMNPEDKNAGRFYCNFKVHKNYTHIPPVRPINSGSGSVTENISLFVNHHIKDLSNTHPSYIQDTPDFLREIENINAGPELPENATLVALDVDGLFTNIPHEDGISTMKEALDERVNPKVPSAFIVELMQLVLQNNLFTFHDATYKQLIGVAMGTHPAPPYADIFMARKIDKKITDLASLEFTLMLLTLKRFLDDYFMIVNCSTKKLHEFFDKINKIHPSIKLTMTHTSKNSEPTSEKCHCEETPSIQFLDTSCSIVNRRIKVDLFRKKSDRNQYLLTSSCHPVQTTKNIPYSLALRIIRVCNEPVERDLRLKELKDMLIFRNYPNNLVDRAIDKAREVPRELALRKVTRNKQTNRPVFAISYDPRLPAINNIQTKHWRSMTSQNQYLAEVFPEPPLTAYKRQSNLRQHLIRAKVADHPSLRPKRESKGMKMCGKGCTACPYILQAKNITHRKTNWKLNKKLDCNSYNIVYMIECQKDNCKKRYVGESKRSLKHRLAEHRGYVINKHMDKTTGAHFSTAGHSLSDLKIMVIEQVKKKDTEYRKQREKYFIQKFNTLNTGLNKKI